MRRYGDTKKHGINYTMRPGAYAILPYKNTILLTHQGAPHNEYQLPGGGIDYGESPIAALHREVLEETGWRISSPRLYSVYRRYVFMPDYDMWAEKICKIYIAKPIRSLSAPLEVGHTAKWFSHGTAIKALKNQGDRDILQRALT